MSSSDITEKNIAYWDDIFARRAWGKYPPEELVRFIARTFPEAATRRQQRILEVGCGPGANLWFLSREGFEIAGIDGSAHAINEAKERLRRENLADEQRVDLRTGNFAKLPWSDASFDAVIDIVSIYANTMPTIRSVIAEVHRVLKPGGWFFMMVFAPETTGATSGKKLEEGTTADPAEGPLQGLGVTHVFTDQELRGELKMFGEISLDWMRRSDRGGMYEFTHWIAQARK
ncbi:MAG: class I SAM-dependent methyltransferase [bacterium]